MMISKMVNEFKIELVTCQKRYWKTNNSPRKENYSDQAYIILPVMKSHNLLATSHLCMDNFPCMEITWLTHIILLYMYVCVSVSAQPVCVDTFLKICIICVTFLSLSLSFFIWF